MPDLTKEIEQIADELERLKAERDTLARALHRQRGNPYPVDKMAMAVLRCGAERVGTTAIAKSAQARCGNALDLLEQAIANLDGAIARTARLVEIARGEIQARHRASRR